MPNLYVGLGVAQALSLLISVAFITYVATIVIPYLRHKPKPVGNAAGFSWHLFIPARDEEAVIGETLEHLLKTFPSAHIWVVDDASKDATARIVRGGRHGATPDRVHLVSRQLPHARTGKGDALNAAYQALDNWLPADIDRHQVVVGVLDADGLLAANCFDVIAADHLFGNPEVGAVQICVRMVNRDERRPFPALGRGANTLGRLLVRMQDLEFRAPISAIQMIRQRTKTVGLGGNGQFARLSALDDICESDRRPWRGSLLEDYELSLHLLLAGFRSEYTMDTLVDQEGLPSLRRLLTQRTRWGQGTMQCGAYLPRIWASRKVTTIGAIEASYYLMQPWLQLLGTLLYPIPVLVLAYNIWRYPGEMGQFLVNGGWMLIILFAVLGLGPFMMWGPLYARRCERGIGVVRSVGYGFAYSLFITTFYITCWRAFFRILAGRRGWAKTRRNIEVQSGPVALEA
jgi:1,2-diacylglycerol 3-beta-glucosyltransferase